MDRIHRQRTLHADHGTDAGITGLEFHGGKSVCSGRRPRAAVALQVHAQQTSVTEGSHQLARRDLAFLPPVGNFGADDVVDNGTRDVTDAPLFFAQQIIEGDQVKGMHVVLLSL